MNRSEAEKQAKPPAGAAWSPPRREPFIARKRAERQQARRRVAAQTRAPLTAEQRALDPLSHPRRGSFMRATLVLLVAAVLHIAVVVVGSLIGGNERGKRENFEQTVRVEVREPPPPPPPPPEAKRAEPPPPEPIVKKAPAPPKTKVPAPEPKGPPPRVVGISLDSTVEGGGGPAFATGETHNGQTADRATAPKPPSEAPAPSPAPAPVAQSSNQVASRIPVAGVKYTQPKRRRPHEPAYPETLKAQELEADVSVMVSIDTEGKVTKVKIITPSPYPEFNQAADKAAHEEEFEPATRDGVAIPFTLSYTYRFRLETQ